MSSSTIAPTTKYGRKAYVMMLFVSNSNSQGLVNEVPRYKRYLSKSQFYRIVGTLTRYKFLERVNAHGKYRLGYLLMKVRYLYFDVLEQTGTIFDRLMEEINSWVEGYRRVKDVIFFLQKYLKSLLCGNIPVSHTPIYNTDTNKNNNNSNMYNTYKTIEDSKEVCSNKEVMEESNKGMGSGNVTVLGGGGVLGRIKSFFGGGKDKGIVIFLRNSNGHIASQWAKWLLLNNYN